MSSSAWQQDNDQKSAPHILRDLPTVSALMAAGQLVLPYMSSITITETPLEILTDKIRALYERVYVKGRDVFDLWWLVRQLQVIPTWSAVHKKLEMYQTEFKAARKTDYFQDPSARSEIRDALESELPRFIPPNILGVLTLTLRKARTWTPSCQMSAHGHSRIGWRHMQ